MGPRGLLIAALLIGGVLAADHFLYDDQGLIVAGAVVIDLIHRLAFWR